MTKGRPIDAVTVAEYQVVAEVSEAAAEALARSRGHLVAICCQCGVVMRVGTGSIPRASTGSIQSRYRSARCSRRATDERR